jgi:ABC-2 type transport system permease protein
VNPWRLEWYRLVRTRRWLALLGVYVLFGLGGPLLTAYMDQLVATAGGGFTIITPEPTPAMAIEQYVSNASQIGLLVAIVVAAGGLSVDVRPEIGVFFRTRVPSALRLLAPRYVVATGAVVVAFLVGVVAAWYETVVLIGAPDAAGTIVGALLGALYLAFVVAVVALAASLAPSVVTTVAISIGVLLALPLVGIVEVVAPYLPSALVGALPDLAGGGAAGDYLRATLTTVAATAAILALAVARTGRREL